MAAATVARRLARLKRPVTPARPHAHWSLLSRYLKPHGRAMAVLRRANRILVLADGQVESTGRRDELLDSSEELRRIWGGGE